MQLKNMLEEIALLKSRAEYAIPKNSATINMHISRKRAAEVKLPEAKREYKSALLTHIVPLVVTGSLAEEFAQEANHQVGIVTEDGEGIYKELLNRMPKEASSGKMSTKVVVDILTRHFTDIASDSDVLEFPQILYKNSRGFAIKNEEDLKRLIKMAVNESVGPEMATIFNLKKIADKAIDMEFNGEKAFLPVLFVVSDGAIVDQIIKGQKNLSLTSYLLTSGEVSNKVKTKALAAVESVTKESVSNALKAVKSNLKKGKKS